MATIQDLEEELVDILEGALEDLDCRVVAEPNPGRARLPQADREVLVGWIGDDIGPISTIDRGRSRVNRKFRIVVRFRSLREHQESYEVIDTILHVVHLLQLNNTIACTPIGTSLLQYDEESGYYVYEVDVEFRTYLVYGG
jgi:hypothetical protein